MTDLYLDYCLRHGVTPDPASAYLLGDKDATPLVRRLNAIIPVSYAETQGRVIASCYPALRGKAEAFLSRWNGAGASLFSEAAFRALDDALSAEKEAWGYRCAPLWCRYAVSCAADPTAKCHWDAILPGTVRLSPDNLPQKSLVSMKLSDCAARGAYAILTEAGEVCAIASVNRVSDAQHCVEIGVECAPLYRRRGYASSCTAALTKALTDEGKTVLYQYYHTNTGSGAVAARVGFVPCGRFFAYSLVRV